MTEQEKEIYTTLKAKYDLWHDDPNWDSIACPITTKEDKILAKLMRQKRREDDWSYNFRYKIETNVDSDFNEKFVIRFYPINPELVGQSGKFRGTSAEYIWDYLTNKIDFAQNVSSQNPISYNYIHNEWIYGPSHKEVIVSHPYDFKSAFTKENSNIMTLTLTDEAENMCLKYERAWRREHTYTWGAPDESIGFYNKALEIIKVDLLKRLDLFAKLYSIK